jgi:hypothetical protein
VSLTSEDGHEPKRALRPILEGAGVEFEATTNHEALWSIIGAGGSTPT